MQSCARKTSHKKANYVPCTATAVNWLVSEDNFVLVHSWPLSQRLGNNLPELSLWGALMCFYTFFDSFNTRVVECWENKCTCN